MLRGIVYDFGDKNDYIQFGEKIFLIKTIDELDITDANAFRRDHGYTKEIVNEPVGGCKHKIDHSVVIIGDGYIKLSQTKKIFMNLLTRNEVLGDTLIKFEKEYKYANKLYKEIFDVATK